MTVTNNGAVVDNNGKIGKCYSFDGSDDGIRIDGNIIPQLQQNNFSICFWLFSNDAGDRSIYIATTPASDWGFSIEKTTANKLRVYWQGNPDFYSSLDIPDQQWCHIAVVIKDGNCYCYKNGEKLAERTSGDMTPAKLSRTWIYAQLGRDTRTGTTVLKGKMNDFRWYDHALSPLEVKQISQGLILHYPLSETTIENTINLMPISLQNTTCEGSSDAKFYEISVSQQGFYTLSYDIKREMITDNWTLPRTSLYARDINNVDYKVITDGNIPKDGKWHHHSITLDTRDTSRTLKSLRGWLFDHSSGTSSKYVSIRNVQLEFKDHETLYTPTIRNNNIIYDCSGYQNNGEKINSLTCSQDTPKYNISTHFGATNQKIHIENLTTTGFSNSYSFAWWGKRSSNTPMFWGFSNGNRLNGMYYGYLWNTGDGTSNPIYKPNTTTQITAPSLNTWHHYVMTGDGTTCKLYLNGELYGQAKTYKSITGTSIYINGWDSGTAYCHDNMDMSDFRIYATALSADDVKSLYQNSAYIDNQGNIYGAVYEEA